MNVLMLEDRGATAYGLRTWLEATGDTVLDAFNINDANTFWNERGKVPVHCIIADLDLPLDGLTDEQKEEVRKGALPGWLWLRDTVLKDEPGMRGRIIIYSGYIPKLRKYLQKQSLSPERELNGIFLLPKSSRSSSADAAAEKIKAIRRIAEKKG